MLRTMWQHPSLSLESLLLRFSFYVEESMRNAMVMNAPLFPKMIQSTIFWRGSNMRGTFLPQLLNTQSTANSSLISLCFLF